MSGTKAGGIKAAKTNKKRHGKDFYAKIGQKGGQNGHTGGFAANPELARKAGQIGGMLSRRTGVKNGEGKTKKRAKKHSKPVPKKEGLLKKIFGGK